MNISCIKLTASALEKDENLTRPFNVMYLYRDVVFSLNSSRCGDYVDPIYHIEQDVHRRRTDNAMAKMKIG